MAIAGFCAAIFEKKRGLLTLQFATTFPLLIAFGLFARGFSVRKLPKRIVVGPDAIVITTNRSERRYSWSEIGSAAKANVSLTPTTRLCITDMAGRTIVQVDESFPDFERLVGLVESYVDARPDDTSRRLMARKARRTSVLCFVVGAVMCCGAIFIAVETRSTLRAELLLQTKGVSGQGELVRRFVAPDRVTKRIEYRVAGAEVRNVEVEPRIWDLLEQGQAVPVILVPEEPDISRLAEGEIRNDDILRTAWGGYGLAGLSLLLGLFLLVLSPFMWVGYDLTFDEKQRIWMLKRHGRVVWASKQADGPQA